MGAILPVLEICGPDGDRCAAVLNDTCYSRHITPCLRPIFPSIRNQTLPLSVLSSQPHATSSCSPRCYRLVGTTRAA
ncbi:hypothetical protein ACFONI_01350 [Aeromonas media]|uniref:hypothetical protein n=1 Tax=Aeromonas media TaxID=651 RepID=UPI00360E2895